jgi:hypothetical protein
MFKESVIFSLIVNKNRIKSQSNYYNGDFKYVFFILVLISKHCIYFSFFFPFQIAQNYGIFISNSDASKGTWLENNRTLEYYLLKNGVLKKKNNNSCLFNLISFMKIIARAHLRN